jgi:hypothetical protein
LEVGRQDADRFASAVRIAVRRVIRRREVRQLIDRRGREGRRRRRNWRLFTLQPVVVERLGQIADRVFRIVGRTQIVLAEIDLAETTTAPFVGQAGERDKAFQLVDDGVDGAPTASNVPRWMLSQTI